MSAVLKESVVDAASRYNIYRVIHKALRAFMTDTLLKIGKMDVTDDSERAEAIEQLRELLTMCDSHLQHENDFIHSALDKVKPHAASRTADDHKHHQAAIASLRREVAQFDSASANRLTTLAQDLYLNLSTFVAENFEHMVMEEVANHAELVAAYSDNEVIAIEQSIVASLDPREAYVGKYWMIPYINSSERALLLGAMKQHAPREVFNAVLELARQRLSQRDFYKLERALS